MLSFCLGNLKKNVSEIFKMFFSNNTLVLKPSSNVVQGTDQTFAMFSENYFYYVLYASFMEHMVTVNCH